MLPLALLSQGNVAKDLNEELDINEFYKSHENFSKLLKFYTDKAHTTSSLINNNKIGKKRVFYFSRSIVATAIISVIYIIIWNTLGTENMPAKVALLVSIIPLYATIVHPFFIKPLITLFERKD
ncbi:hypothetical protein [Peribacillus asahii]|uniref:hypothetical protein n=1 Tax=Peribacillus asahii TaxID=228899 RepID=UPI00207AD921|nr:hypothetical protein [Peribacillus asahii]USK58117.1 hypothetical protein LIT37_12600 [Peribacillus asahii]